MALTGSSLVPVQKNEKHRFCSLKKTARPSQFYSSRKPVRFEGFQRKTSDSRQVPNICPRRHGGEDVLWRLKKSWHCNLSAILILCKEKRKEIPWRVLSTSQNLNSLHIPPVPAGDRYMPSINGAETRGQTTWPCGSATRSTRTVLELVSALHTQHQGRCASAGRSASSSRGNRDRSRTGTRTSRSIALPVVRRQRIGST
jgi:hypothetical protein